MVTVLSVGGSIVAPEGPDAEFLTSFSALARSWLDADKSRKLILVIGGGGPARAWQRALRAVSPTGADGRLTGWGSWRRA
jgi:uridylate kinase